jgi:tetratricopeptide (TPR) repeat protein
VAEEIRLALDYAELSLESGQPADAAPHVAKARESLQGTQLDALQERARFLEARVLEAKGEEDDAIIAYEELVDDPATSGLARIKAGIALSRVYRENGDLNRAIESGERILADVEKAGLGACDEAVQLTVTIAAAYFERGDAGHAVRMCRKAITRAEAIGSPMARASAYWNASVMQANRGDISAAVPLAERALALLGEGQDARNLARLRAEVGRLQLELDPPAIEDARNNLEQAAAELEWSSAGPVDRAWIQFGLAEAYFLSGDFGRSRDYLASVHATSGGHAALAEAKALALEGRIAAAEGLTSAAADLFQAAVHKLSAVGADQGAAQLWFDLAEMLTSVGLADAASDAYRRAAASTGLRARMSAPAPASTPEHARLI